MRNKIVLITGSTETLEYFSLQLKKGFEALGYQTFLFDMADEEASAERLAHFAGFSDTLLVTFNFDGIHYETALFDGEGRLFWDVRDIPCINIAVDHPFFYPELFALRPKRFCQVCIDRLHQQYIMRFHPEVENSFFLPLAGTSLSPKGDYLPITERKYDVVFAANFAPKEDFDCHIMRSGEEYEAFYRSIIDELLRHPERPDDEVMEEYLLREFPDATDRELGETIANMIFIDTYIRSYFREKAVQLLVDAGVRVHCIGHGWERLTCRHPENLTFEPNTDSHTCLLRLAEAKISLNAMPWFKDGAHDRVFNAMANGSVCLTDGSRYLREILSDGENVVFYDLGQIEKLPELALTLLAQPGKMQQIAHQGFALAMAGHTWEHRAATLHQELLKGY